MKRGVIFLIVLVLLLINNVLAADVAYILKNPRINNSEILGVFSEMNLSVELVKDININKVNLNNYKLVFVGDERLRKTSKIPIYNYPSVIMNKYYGEEWGLTDADGISQLASTAPLQVRLAKNGIKQVYTIAKVGSINIDYYFLDDENKANMQSIARTYTGDIYSFGDVVAFAQAGTHLINGKISGAKICFFGIEETKYWTNNARNLFKECVESVLIVCSSNNECDDFNSHTLDRCENPGTISSSCVHEPIECLNNNECGIDGFIGNSFCNGASGNDIYRNFIDFTCNNAGTAESYCSNATTSVFNQSCNFECENGACLAEIHDIALTDFTNAINGIRLEQNGSAILSDPAQLICNEKYEIGIKVENLGDFFENVTFSGSIGSLLFSHNLINDFAPGENSIKTKTVNFTLASGFYDINVDSIIPIDNNLTNNFASRQTEIICSECSINSDCGSVSFNNYCIGNNVTSNYSIPACISGSCGVNYQQIFNQSCEFGCSNGICLPPIACHNNSDCNDGNISTQDICVNPGTAESSCQHNPITCFVNSDCGSDGFVGGLYCLNNDVYQDYRTFNCNNAGTSSSYCNSNNTPVLIENCEAGCSAGECNPVSLIHDIAIDFNFSNSINGIKIQQNSVDVINDPAQLNCNQSFIVKYKVKNKGEFNETINATGKINSFSWQQALFNLNAGTTSTERTKTVSEIFAAGFYNITLNLFIQGFADANPFDNFASRQIQILCEEQGCIQNSDCGSVSLINNYCIGNNITSNYSVPACNIANGSCSINYQQIFNQTCAYGCLNGSCLPQPECIVDSDCSADYFGNNYCLNNNIWHDFHNFSCAASSCIENVSTEFVSNVSDQQVKNYTSLRKENGLANINITGNGFLIFKGLVHDDLRVILEPGSKTIYCHDMHSWDDGGRCPEDCNTDHVCIYNRNGNKIYDKHMLFGDINRTRIDVLAGEVLKFQRGADNKWDAGLEIWTQGFC